MMTEVNSMRRTILKLTMKETMKVLKTTRFTLQIKTSSHQQASFTTRNKKTMAKNMKPTMTASLC